MLKKKKIVIVFCVFFLFCSITIANYWPQSDKRLEGLDSMKILRFNFAFGDLPTLHPHIGIDLRGRSIGKAIFEGLTRLNAEGALEFAGAKEIEISESKTLYTFHLRPNHWSNGEPVLASDYEKTWKHALTFGSDCRFGEYFFIIKNGEKAKKGEISIDQVGIQAVDDHTLVVELEHPAPYFLGLAATSLFSPLYRGENCEPSFFNGPFLVSSWEREKRLVLGANPHYWDRNNVHLDAMDISMVKDERVSYEMYEKGDLDWSGDPFSPIPQDAFSELSKMGKVQKKEIARICLIFCNTRIFPLNSKKIRQALDLALDRKELSEHILSGQRAHDAPVPFPYSSLEPSYLNGNEIEAKRLFAEALQELGLSKNSFPTLTFSYAQEAIFKNIALYLQRRWEDVLGIKVNLKGYDWNLLFADFNRHQFELGSCFQASFFNDPIYNLAMYEDGSQSVNWTGWENEKYKELLSRSNHTVDVNERNELLKEAEKILVEERPILPLYTQTYFYMKNDDVENLVMTDLGNVEFKHLSFKKR